MDVALYIMYFALPVLTLVILVLIVKFCCSMFCCLCDSADPLGTEQQADVPVYIIPISTEYGDSDGGLAEDNAPPPYDSLDPPPLYAEWKWGLPKEEPPAYSELEVTAATAETSLGASSAPNMQDVF